MFRVVGISFDHMHMGDLLRQVHGHPAAEIAGIFDPDRARMQRAVEAFGILFGAIILAVTAIYVRLSDQS